MNRFFANLKRALAGLSAIALAIALSACTPAEDGGAEDAATPPTEESAAPAEGSETDAATAAAAAPSITGKVTFDGERPKRMVLDMKADPKCAAMHGDGENDKELARTEVIGEDGGIQYVFVQVTNPPEGDYGPPSEPFVLNQEGCRYEPHVFGVVAGRALSIKNSDDTLHNVRSFARRNRPFNLGQPAGSAPRSKTYKKPEEAIKFKCDVHPWMTAYMFVREHPFFDVTDADGTYEISGLPAGEYNVTAWHEVYGEKDGTVTVAEDGTATLDFTFSK